MLNKFKTPMQYEEFIAGIKAGYFPADDLKIYRMLKLLSETQKKGNRTKAEQKLIDTSKNYIDALGVFEEAFDSLSTKNAVVLQKLIDASKNYIDALGVFKEAFDSLKAMDLNAQKLNNEDTPIN